MEEVRESGTALITNEDDTWHKKYCVLKRKCEEYEELNSILLARTKKIREMIGQAETEKRLLLKRLEQFGMVAFQMSPPSSPQEEQLPPVRIEQHSPLPTLKEEPELNSSMYEGKVSLSVATSPPSRADSSPKPPTSKSKARVKGGGGSRRKKGDAQSNAPKKPSNAFFWFCQEHRGSLQDQFRGEGVAGQHDLTKILAKLWSEATADDKKKYYRKYEEDKKRYDREMLEFGQKATSTVPNEAV